MRVVLWFVLKNAVSTDLQRWGLGPGHGKHLAEVSGEL